VVLGVENKTAGAEAFVGTSLAAAFLQKRIWDLSRPRLAVDVVSWTLNGATLLVARVPRSPVLHSDPQGRTTMRVGTDCETLAPDEVARIQNERAGVDWSAETSTRTPGDVSPQAMQAARRFLQTLPDERSGLAELSDLDLLRALGVVDHDGNLLRAGEVLFCETQSPSLVYQYRATPGGEPLAIERLSPPFVISFERSLGLIQARQSLTPVSLPSGQQIHIDDFPRLAVREAVANAVIHRDYGFSSSAINIEHSPEVMVVTSPGPLVTGVTPNNILTHPSNPRNALLAHSARTLGLAEEVGLGVDRMYREMIRAGRDVPSIASSADGVRVTFVGGAPNTQMARYVAQLPPDEREDTDAMLTLFTLRTSKTVNAPKMAVVMQKTDDEAEAVLRRLVGISVIEPTRESARRSHPSYRLGGKALQTLGAAVTYRRRNTDETDRKVIEHVGEWGKITNRTVRNLIDVDTARAAAILGSLMERQIIVKTSEAQRGPSVEYGPGPAFPTKRAPKLPSRSSKSD
jgi:ATP-dependent DNA helicase RecG